MSCHNKPNIANITSGGISVITSYVMDGYTGDDTVNENGDYPRNIN